MESQLHGGENQNELLNVTEMGTTCIPHVDNGEAQMILRHTKHCEALESLHGIATLNIVAGKMVGHYVLWLRPRFALFHLVFTFTLRDEYSFLSFAFTETKAQGN